MNDSGELFGEPRGNRRGGRDKDHWAWLRKKKKRQVAEHVTCERRRPFLPPSTTSGLHAARSICRREAGKKEVYLKHGAAYSTTGGPLLLTACAEDEDIEAEDRGIMGKRQLPLHPS